MFLSFLCTIVFFLYVQKYQTLSSISSSVVYISISPNGKYLLSSSAIDLLGANFSLESSNLSKIITQDSLILDNVEIIPQNGNSRFEARCILSKIGTRKILQIIPLDSLYQRQKKAVEDLDKVCTNVNFLSLNLDLVCCIIDYEDNILLSTKAFEDLGSNKKVLLDLSKKNTKNLELKTYKKYLNINGKNTLYKINFVFKESMILMYGIDINDQDEIEKELNRSVASQSQLLESTSNACAIFSSSRKLEFYNQSFLRLWNLDENWLETKPVYDMILDKLHLERKLPEQANFAEFKKTQVEFFTNLTETFNDFYYLPDGKSLRVIIVPHSLGGLLFSYEDMTDRLALQSSYNTLIDVQKATLDNLHEGICVFGSSGRLTISNPTFTRMWQCIPKLGLHLIEILDVTSNKFAKHEDLVIHKNLLIDAFARRSSVQHRIQKSDGSVISRTLVPLPDGATLLTDLDMTDSVVVEKTLREENSSLQDADRIKNEFLANISYEIRAPLTSIIGLSESLCKNFFGKLNHKQSEYLNDILNAARQLIDIVNEMIDITSITSKHVKLNITSFDFMQAVSEVLVLVSEKMKNMNVDIILNCDFKDPMLQADKVRIKQALFRIINSSIQYSQNINLIVCDTQEQMILELKSDGKKAGYMHDLDLSIAETFFTLHRGNLNLDFNDNYNITCKIPRYFANNEN